MKLRIIGCLLLILFLSAGISTSADAAPWPFRHHHRHYGYYRPNTTAVRVYSPKVEEYGFYHGYRGRYYRHAPYHYGHRYEYRRWK